MSSCLTIAKWGSFFPSSSRAFMNQMSWYTQSTGPWSTMPTYQPSFRSCTPVLLPPWATIFTWPGRYPFSFRARMMPAPM